MTTQVTLLLCGRFGMGRESGVTPLEPREYYRLLAWLEERGLRPADLVEVDLSEEPGLPVAAERLRTLLARGAALALALETWESRGLWVASGEDEDYPERLRRLGRAAPPLLYGAGDRQALARLGQALAVVGSRHVGAETLELAQGVARACAREGIAIVSGGARGVDSAAMEAAIEAGGRAAVVLADNLARAAIRAELHEALVEGRLALVSPYDPEAGFTVGTAMARNKYIYALADAALVVSASAGTGGTWAGAEEALKRGAPPVFVWVDEGAPEGNLRLLELGAHAFPDPPWTDLAGWLAALGDEGAEPEQGGKATQGTLW